MALSRSTNSSIKTAAIASTYPAGSYERHRWTERCEDAETAIGTIESDLMPERALLARTRQAEAARAGERDRYRRQMSDGRLPNVAVPDRTPERTTSSDRADVPPRGAHRFIDQVERTGIAVEHHSHRFTYDAATLQSVGLTDADLAPAAIQSRLAALHARQQREIAGVMKLAGRGFVLDAQSDTPHVRTLIDRWRDRPEVRAALPPPRSLAPMPPDWKRAATLCEALMAGSDADERLRRDARGAIVRGRDVDRATVEPQPARRPHPGLAALLGGRGR